ncbi:MAG: hypothetical protein J2P57_25635, partial [Acidimicrobiaceae bacterium]|nr:hypothetical protein [Acidimicrobiaceae bacterium]
MAAVIAGGAAAPKLASGGAPHLPPISAVSLADKVAHAHAAGLSGTVSLSANLGLPAGIGDIANAGESFNITSLLSGTHRFDVWFAGGGRQRVSLTKGAGETDVIRDGGQLWVYQSATQKVTHLSIGSGGPTARRAADALVKRLAPDTTIQVGPSVEVAGRSCYTLRLRPTPGTPDARDSTISRIDVAVDAANGVPLRFEVFSTTQRRPALALGFVGSVSFGTPGRGM